MQGTYTALITPFTSENKIDFAAMEDLIERQINAGIDGLVLLGTTGESPTINAEERKEIISFAVRVIKERIPLVIGTGTNNTASSLQRTKQAKELGADAALVVVPYYNKPTPNGSLLHFREVAKANFPVILYHHPGRTGVFLSVDLIVRMAKEKLITSVKETTADLEFTKKLIEQSSLPILSGEDFFTPTLMDLGGEGTISAASNVIPEKIKEVVRKRSLGEIEPLLKVLYKETNPICIKYALAHMGLCQPIYRLPMTEPEEANKKEIETLLQKVALQTL